jgi:hypothetical protein
VVAPSAADTPAELIISACTVLAHDDQEGIGVARDAAIVVRDGAVEAVTTTTEAAVLPAAEPIDASGQVALPGLTNCHTHAPVVALRGLAGDLPTEERFNDVVWPGGSGLTATDVELGAWLARAEMIRAGVTCFAGHYFAMDAVARVVAECGLRVLLGEASFSSQGPEGRERSLEFALRHRGAADGRITTALAAREDVADNLPGADEFPLSRRSPPRTDRCHRRAHVASGDRLARPVACGARGTAAQGEGRHPRAGRAQRRAARTAHGGGRREVRVRGRWGQGHAARPVRGPAPARRLPLHVRARVGRGLPRCSGFLDQIGHLAHLKARDTSFAAVSRAPCPRLLPFKARMGWMLPWYSSYGSDFNRDFEVTLEREGELVERPGLSCFLRDRDRVFHTCSTYERGLDGLGSTTSLLDLTALGRREEWEEPKGRASAFGAPAGSERIRYHDEYDD